MEDIYRSETLLVRSIPAEDRRRWVVTFDHYDMPAGFDRPGFGEAFFASQGISQVNVLARGNDWYHYPDLDQALACAREALAGADRVLTYGSSMGGYAAIRFADRVGAHVALALSPQYSNDPRKVPFEWRWRNDAARIGWAAAIDGPIRTAARVVVMADARREDAAHVALISADIPIESVALAYTGHPIGTYLSSVGMLPSAVLHLLEDRFDAAAFQRGADARRRTAPVYLSELARLQPPHRPRTGIALARRALAHAPDNPLVHHILAQKLTAAGEFVEALSLHARATAMSNGYNGYALPYSEALAASGDGQAALVIARELVERDPRSPPLQSWLAHLYWSSGERDAARHHAAIAHELAPHNELYTSNLALYRQVPLRRSRVRTVKSALRRWLKR